MVVSPEWLPPGFAVKIKHRSGKKLKYYLHVATGKKYNSKNEVIRCAEENNKNPLVTPLTKNADVNGPSSVNKVDAVSEKTNDSARLPNGWTVEERRRKSGSAAGLSYKIDKVGDPLPDTSLQISPTRNTRSISLKKRKADSPIKINNVDETVTEKLPQILSTTNTDGTHEQRTNGNSLVKKIDNVVEPFPDMSPQVLSTTNKDGIHKMKKKISSFVTVAVECTTDDDLPKGWIKEIRTSKCGNKIRKDPFYTDPVSGYMFRSKPDALRFLKTNDIRSCACKPLKRELDGIKSMEKRNHSSTQAKLKGQPLLGEESNGEISGVKSPAESGTNTMKREQVDQENSNMSAEMGNNPEAEVKVIVDASTSSAGSDPLTNQQLPESRGRNKVGSRKSKKRREPSTPLRISRRLAGSEPEMQLNLDLNEHPLRGSTAKEVDASPIVPNEASYIHETSNIQPAKEVVEKADICGEETRQDVNQPKEVEKPPLTEGSTVPEEQSGATATASTNPLVDGQQSHASQLCYDFGDSWTDPLEFALKTLKGELPIEDALTFPSCFREPLGTTFSQIDGCLKQSQFHVPVNFQREFPCQSESSKKQNAVDPGPATAPSSFSALGSSCSGGFNLQPSAEVRKKDSQTKFNP
ncbi:uncharacterized protein LOC121756281 isoform X2 [Salvia splendens]|uniref:uncharacterized protein LOC121756281 isoform X2 n=1 Tax=Salvia splendens TaxID=180675 RepID=UPI001C25A2D5|nr:uncharacterized protein LOC121756281 isoform X2 [Salvia splendens]